MTEDNSAVIARLQADKDALVEALRSCSMALREEVEARRGHEPDRRVDRDLAEADDADDLLASLESEPLAPAVPERWSVERRDGMYLIQQKDADGSFTKGLWIDPDQYSYVLCEMLNDMQQGGRE